MILVPEHFMEDAEGSVDVLVRNAGSNATSVDVLTVH